MSFTSCDKDPEVINPNDDDDGGGDDGDNNEPVESNLPDSIKNGSNFYVLFMDAESETTLNGKIKVATMLRNYDVWNAGETLAGVERTGVNSWGVPAAWVAFDVLAPDGWNGGAIIATLEEFETIPDLSPIFDGDYYFHVATKSPNNQPNAGTMLIFYSEGQEIKYFFGPLVNKPADCPNYGGNYAHDGEWHHFEIPVAELASKGYLWTTALNMAGNPSGRRYLLGFMSFPGNVPGQEINLDAIFFYKKPAK
ncbi:hypothetical protein FACS189413_14610 [Bacteroidia bacterium]|nr:hypothetical protein FACS189413_14610 [Bacteroidia bacterium]